MFEEYYDLLSKWLEYLQKLLFDFKMKTLSMLYRGEFFQYRSGDLVYIISSLTSQLITSSRKVSVKYVGPVLVYMIIDPKSFLLCILDGKLLLGPVEHGLLKAVIITTTQGNITHLTSVETSFVCRYQI